MSRIGMGAPRRLADRVETFARVTHPCMQVKGRTGVPGTRVAQLLSRKVRVFRIYDGPAEVHKWSLVIPIKRDWKASL